MAQHMISPSSKLTDVNFTAFKMIKNKVYSPYDLQEHLKKYKGTDFQSPLEIISATGHNLLHEIVDQGRMSMFIVIITFGWWKILSKQKVQANSSSEHKGCTAEQIANKKKVRIPHEEMKQYSAWEQSLTPLMTACRSGDVAKARLFVEKNAQPMEIFHGDAKGWNALFWAVMGESQEIILLLLNAGLDASIKSKKGETLLHIAAIFGKSHLLHILLEDDRCKLDPYTDDLNNKSPYDKVSENGDIESLEVLISCGYNPKPQYLVLAAYHGRKECVEYCLTNLRMDVNGVDLYSRTALHRACENRKEDIAMLLLSHGAKINLRTSMNRNLLHILAESGSVSMMADFLELLRKDNMLGDVINQKDRYNGVELCFIIRGRDKGKNRHAWHYVEVKRQVVSLFLKKTRHGNVDVALFGTVVKSGFGVNPDQETVKSIEDTFKERRLNQQADLDMTPLHVAVFKGHKDIVKLLINNGAKVNEQDLFGLSPLMLAATKGDLDVVKQLEKAGAAFEDISKDRKTALQLADENEQDEVIQYIRGRKYFEISQNFVKAKLAIAKEGLSQEKLDDVRANGQDVNVHLVSVLRDLNIDINVYLEKLGSGPILEVTEES